MNTLKRWAANVAEAFKTTKPTDTLMIVHVVWHLVTYAALINLVWDLASWVL